MKKIIPLFLILISISLFSQDTINKWYCFKKSDIVSYSLSTISGICFGFNQAIVHHEYGKGKQFIDYNISWKNKYKNYDKGNLSAKYFGSKTFLVWTTDLYHLTATGDKLFLVSSVFTSTYDLNLEINKIKKKNRKYFFIKKFLIPVLIKGLVFQYVFNHL